MNELEFRTYVIIELHKKGFSKNIYKKRLIYCCVTFPYKRTIIDLSPADIKKEGADYRIDNIC